MVTATERLAEIQRIQQARPDEKLVFVQPSKKPKVEGFREIDPTTGELGGSRFREEFGEGAELIAIEDPAI
ncbi:hypothetical protein LCGC14_2979260, partial [marine sediment metagenome]